MLSKCNGDTRSCRKKIMSGIYIQKFGATEKNNMISTSSVGWTFQHDSVQGSLKKNWSSHWTKLFMPLLKAITENILSPHVNNQHCIQQFSSLGKESVTTNTIAETQLFLQGEQKVVRSSWSFRETDKLRFYDLLEKNLFRHFRNYHSFWEKPSKQSEPNKPVLCVEV